MITGGDIASVNLVVTLLVIWKGNFLNEEIYISHKKCNYYFVNNPRYN